VVAGKVSGQNCSHAPVKVLPWYLGSRHPSRHVRALEQKSHGR